MACSKRAGGTAFPIDTGYQVWLVENGQRGSAFPVIDVKVANYNLALVFCLPYNIPFARLFVVNVFWRCLRALERQEYIGGATKRVCRDFAIDR